MDGAGRELAALWGLKRHDELLERATEALALALHLGDLNRQIQIHRRIAKAQGALEHPDAALTALWRADELATRCKDPTLAADIRDEIIERLAQDLNAHADELVDAYLDWLQREPLPAADEDGDNPFWSDRPPLYFDEFAAAATRCDAWPRVADALARWQQSHPRALDALPATSPAAGNTIADLAAEQGTGPAFSAAAGLLRTVGALRTAAEPNPALAGFMTRLAQAACTRFIVRLSDIRAAVLALLGATAAASGSAGQPEEDPG